MDLKQDDDTVAVGDKTWISDSDTGMSLLASKVVDVTDLHTEYAQILLVYTKARRGRIVQICRDGVRTHYFYDEPGSQEMISDSEVHYGFTPGALLSAIQQNAD